MFIWLLTSIVVSKDPISTISDLFSSNDESLQAIISYDTLYAQHQRQSDSISILTEELAICNGQKQYKRAMIDIESSTVNMRSKASLNSEIIMQIPNRSIVQVLYYDTERFVLNQKYGKWCRISYAGTEGWIWGNFIRELD